MSFADLNSAERHRQIAGDFTIRVQGVTDWDAPTPVAGWTTHDVVDHLLTWLPGLLSTGGVAFPTNPSVTDDPVAAWSFHANAVQELLDDPERAAAPCSHPQVGSMSAGDAIDRLYTSDVFMHTWDLARASGQDATLEPGFCTHLLAGMEAMEDAIRASGQYGTRVEVPPDADPQTRLLGFIGRDPSWQPDRPAS